jgi:hypothetical protein
VAVLFVLTLGYSAVPAVDYVRRQGEEIEPWRTLAHELDAHQNPRLLVLRNALPPNRVRRRLQHLSRSPLEAIKVKGIKRMKKVKPPSWVLVAKPDVGRMVERKWIEVTRSRRTARRWFVYRPPS